jgi:hypothetical protein
MRSAARSVSFITWGLEGLGREVLMQSSRIPCVGRRPWAGMAAFL